MGQTAQQDPTLASVDQASQVPDVPKSTGEKAMGVLGGLVGRSKGSPLDDAIQQHHQKRLDEARMHRRTAAQALGIYSYGIDPKTGEKLTPEQEQQYLNEWNSAMEHYQKVAGVNKETKAAIQKSKMLAEYTAQQQRKQQGQGGQAGAQGAPPPPPAPEAQSPSPSAAPAGPAGGPPPPVPFAEQAPFLTEQLAESRQIEGAKRVEQAMVTQRQGFAKQLGMDPSQLSTQEYILTGKIPASATSQHKFQKGPVVMTPEGIPRQSIFDPASGEYVDPKTHEAIDGATPMSAADLAAHTINVMKPDGKPEIMFRRGNKVYNNDGELQEGELMPFQRGMLPTTSDREVMGFDENGMPTKYMLRTTRKVGTSGSGAASGGPPAPSATKGEASGGGAGKPAAAQGSGKPPHVVMPAAQYNQMNKSRTAILEARNSLIGDDPEQVGGLAADMQVFKDPKSVERISNYLGLVNNQIENEARAVAGQGVTSAIEWYANLPQTIIGLQQGALRDASKGLTPADQKFVADYFRVMGTLGGMRASTGMPAARWSYNTLRSELPTPGPVTDYNEASRRLMNYVRETNVVSKGNALVPKVDTADLRRKMDMGGAPNTSGELQPPRPAKSGMKWQHRSVNGKVEWREVAAK